MRRRGQTIRAATAAVGLTLLVTACGGSGEGGGSEVREVTPAPGTDVAVSQDPNPIIARNSPALAVNPTQRTNMVIVDRVNRPDFSAGIHVSNNGGTVWQQIPLKAPAASPGKPFSPSATYDARGTL